MTHDFQTSSRPHTLEQMSCLHAVGREHGLSHDGLTERFGAEGPNAAGVSLKNLSFDQFNAAITELGGEPIRPRDE